MLFDGGRWNVPLYEYLCQACGRFELLQKFSDEQLTKCPTCEREIHRVISAPAIRFKGNGWYVTDYAAKPGNGSSKQSEVSADSASTPKKTTSKDSSASGSSPTK